jgi:coenzyme F420-reducing hydrogenase alpha subunit
LIIYPVTHKEEKYKTHIFVSNRASNNETKFDDDTIKEKLDADSKSKEYMKQQYCKSSSYKCSREMMKNHKLEQVKDGYQSRDVIQK